MMDPHYVHSYYFSQKEFDLKSRNFNLRNFSEKLISKSQNGNILVIICKFNVMKIVAYVSVSVCVCMLMCAFPHAQEHAARSTLCLWCHKM